jgi:hypothetical protein
MKKMGLPMRKADRRYTYGDQVKCSILKGLVIDLNRVFAE